MALVQTQQQKQLLKMSPQQIQLMKLLQIPSIHLEQRIKEELDNNPALEIGSAELDDIEQNEISEDVSTEESEDVFNEEGEYYDTDDEPGEYQVKETVPEGFDKTMLPLPGETSFYEYLANQLGMLNLTERTTKICEQIIGSIDLDGYLRIDAQAIIDDVSFIQNIETNLQEVESLIQQVQQLEPAGIGARNLQECLLIQLKKKPATSTVEQVALRVIEHYFELFAKKKYTAICEALQITPSTLQAAIHTITKLNPKPAEGYSSGSNAPNFLTPDYYVTSQNGELELTLNPKNYPEVRLSNSYKAMTQTKDKLGVMAAKKEDISYVKQKIESAKWFIDLLQQRQVTLYNTMNSILQYQQAFFLTGDENTLKSMILKDIAKRTQLDISTISRVVRNKFVQTEFGTYPLKFFFGESLSTNDGSEVSTKQVKNIIGSIIQNENKTQPLNDDALTQQLLKKGFNIARRTVTKYREQLNLPVARLRRTNA